MKPQNYIFEQNYIYGKNVSMIKDCFKYTNEKIFCIKIANITKLII